MILLKAGYCFFGVKHQCAQIPKNSYSSSFHLTGCAHWPECGRMRSTIQPRTHLQTVWQVGGVRQDHWSTSGWRIMWTLKPSLTIRCRTLEDRIDRNRKWTVRVRVFMGRETAVKPMQNKDVRRKFAFHFRNGPTGQGTTCDAEVWSSWFADRSWGILLKPPRSTEAFYPLMQKRYAKADEKLSRAQNQLAPTSIASEPAARSYQLLTEQLHQWSRKASRQLGCV